MLIRHVSLTYVFSIVLVYFCAVEVKAGQISVINPSAGSAYIDTTPITMPDSGRPGLVGKLNFADQTVPSKRVEKASRILDETSVDSFSKDELNKILFLIEDSLSNNLSGTAKLVLKKQRARVLEVLKKR